MVSLSMAHSQGVVPVLVKLGSHHYTDAPQSLHLLQVNTRHVWDDCLGLHGMQEGMFRPNLTA